MPRLLVNLGPSGTTQIDLKTGPNTLGRAADNDFVISDPSVSSHHCQIMVGAEAVILKDLHSTNGTYLNRAPVQEAVLVSGQTIHLGAVQMSYLVDGPQPATTPPVRAVAAAPAVAAKRVSTISIPVRVVQTQTAVGSVPPPSVPLAVAAPVAPPPAPLVPASPPVALPVAPPPAAAIALPPAGQQFCKSHTKTQARFYCGHCRVSYCELCVDTRPVSGISQKFCRHCGAACQALQVQQRKVEKPKGFFALLPQAFVYPFRGSGVLVLIIGAIIFGALNFFTGGISRGPGILPRAFGWSIIFGVMATGYLFAYMQNILHATATGEEELPPLPSMTDFWQDILLPCLQLLAILLLCLGPAVALEIWYMFSMDPNLLVLMRAARIAGYCYFPMAFLAVAMLDTILAANPIQVLGSIIKVPIQYVVTLVFAGILLSLRSIVGDELLPSLFPLGFATKSMPKLLAMISLQAVWGVLSLYLLTVTVRLLGQLYTTNKEKLGWFKR